MAQSASSITTLEKGTRPNLVTPLSTPLTSPAILAWGDSTTVGYTTGDTAPLPVNAWRLDLHTMLTRGGMSPTWIGPTLTGSAPSNAGKAGVGLSLADYIAASEPATTLASYDPDIVIIYLGLNDADDATESTNFGTNMVNFVTDIHNDRAGRRFVIGYPHDGGDATRRGRLVSGVWPGVASAVASLLGSGINVVAADCRSLTWQAHMIISEGTSAIHPRSFSYTLIADALYPAVMNACGLNAEW